MQTRETNDLRTNPSGKSEVPPAIAQLSTRLGDRLRAVVAYSSLSSASVEDVVFDWLIVTRPVGPHELQAISELLGKPARGAARSLLILSMEELKDSLDAYPVEFLWIRETGTALSGTLGDSDLDIQPEPLRLQCERELRGLVFHARNGFIYSQGKPAVLGGILQGSTPRLLLLLSATARVLTGKTATHSHEVIDALAQLDPSVGKPLARLFELSRERKPSVDAAEFLLILSALETLVRRVDRCEGKTP